MWRGKAESTKKFRLYSSGQDEPEGLCAVWSVSNIPQKGLEMRLTHPLASTRVIADFSRDPTVTTRSSHFDRALIIRIYYVDCSLLRARDQFAKTALVRILPRWEIGFMTMLIAPEPSRAWGSLDVGGGCRGTGLVTLLSLLGTLLTLLVLFESRVGKNSAASQSMNTPLAAPSLPPSSSPDTPHPL
ncbi:hypothetical protein KC320_g215 [Hortaea werneckii]|nr:hypothetical protein KC320_g215 [Hortaea werneckii]